MQKHNYIPTLTMKPTDEKGGLFEKLVQRNQYPTKLYHFNAG